MTTNLQVDFGHVIFPSVLSVPRPTVVGKLSNPTHGLSSGNVTVTDVVTIKVDNFEFDGLEKGGLKSAVGLQTI